MARPVRRRLRTALIVAALAVLGAGILGYSTGWLPSRFGTEPPPPDPLTEPDRVPPPPGLELAVPATPPPVLPPAAEPGGRPGAVRKALRPLVSDPDLGRHVVVAVAPLDGTDPVFTMGEGPVIPASTTKLLTTVAALATLGPGHRFTTEVRSGPGDTITLVGGGDPFLAARPSKREAAYPERADVVTLARLTARALRAEGVDRVRLRYDDSLFTGPTTSPTWPPDYLIDVVAPITALWVDEGRPASGYGRVEDPSRYAADAFAAALRGVGITVSGPVRPGRAKPGSPVVAAVHSAPLDQIVEQILAVSDNEAAEVLGHQVGLATGGAGDFTDGAAGVRRTLAGLGIRLPGLRLYDGSGLSRENRLRATTLLDLLRVAASEEHPELRSVITGLPVAAYSGSLAYRFQTGDPVGRGRVRAKTGTLTGVSGLAGIATDRRGNSWAFALLADRIKVPRTLAARDALDALAAALGSCRC